MEIRIEKVSGVDAGFRAPPSKSHTHRALIAASLGTGESRILRPLRSDDILVTVEGLRRLGVPIAGRGEMLLVGGRACRLGCEEGCDLRMGDSGTSARFFMPLAALAKGPVTIGGSGRLQERPIRPLAEAIAALGGEIRWMGREGFLPVQIRGRLRGGRVSVRGSESSQFISALLLSSPCTGEGMSITCPEPPVSRPYIDITLETMELFGVRVERENYSRFDVAAGERYLGREYLVEGDYSSASYFFAIAAVCGGRVRVSDLNPDSLQADRRFLQALERMGCRVRSGRDLVEVERTGELAGIEIDMADAPDSVQTLCTVAACASSPTTVHGISHLKWKESDRIQAIARVLVSAGAGVEIGPDRIVVRPAPLHGAEIDPEGDHRTAMSAAVLGLATGGFVIRNAECVRKSFPGFWDALRGAELL